MALAVGDPAGAAEPRRTLVRILSVQHALPSKRITNDDVRHLVREHNHDRFDERGLAGLQDQVVRLLDRAGTQVRYSLAEGERALPLVSDAAQRALEDSGMSPADVEFVIFVGVGRAFVEPAMANVVQAELGLRNATCFDVLDGCASWLRALQIAQLYLDSGTYRAGLIVNAECGFAGYMDWRIRKPEDLVFHFATFTIGEAATATLVADDGQRASTYFRFRSFGDRYGLCMIPLEGAADFLHDVPPWYGSMKLYSLSHELLIFAADQLVETFLADDALSGERYDIVFGHAASSRAEEGVLERIGIPLDRYFGTHAGYGNTVSASVPPAMSLACYEGRLTRGDRVLIIMASGGVAIGFAKLTF